MGELWLPGIDGSNPLAFLAALGALRTLSTAWRERDVKLSWRAEAGWTPVLGVKGDVSSSMVLDALDQSLRAEPSKADPVRVKELDRAARRARKAIKEASVELKQEAQDKGLRGRAATAHVKAGTASLRLEADRCDAEHRAALAGTVALPQLGLGNDLNVSPRAFREHALQALSGARPDQRTWADFVAAYGSDAWPQDEHRIRATPLSFVSGAGHQYFLKTYADLVAGTRREHLERALFQTWKYEDERLSFRWDPAEDRRYALRWNNPSDDPAATMWGANRLAIEALPLFPSAPGDRCLETLGWRASDDGAEWTWPIWSPFLSLAAVSTLVGLHELIRPSIDRRDLHARGVVEVLRATRVLKDKRVNFTASTPAQTRTSS